MWGVLLVAAVLQQTVPEQKMAIGSATLVHVHARAGTIEIRGGTGQEVRVRGSVPFELDHGGKTLTIRPKDMKAVQEVSFVVEMPAGVAVRTTSWFTDVTIANIRAAIEVDAREGTVTVNGGEGVTTVRAVNGRVSIAKRDGAMTVSGAASDITLDGVGGTFTLDSTSGALTLTNVRASGVEALTVSGNITFDGPLSERGTYKFSTHTGAIDVTVPAATRASITTVSATGVLESTPHLEPKSVTPGRLSTRVYQLGEGGAQIDLRTFGGKLTFAVRQKD